MLPEETRKAILEQLDKANGNMPYIYLKFCKERKYAEDVCNGLLFANTPQYFRELERKSGVRGQGDAHEVISEIDVQNILIFDESGRLIAKADKGKQQMKFENDANVPLVCFVGVTISEMEVLDIEKSFIRVRFPFSDDEYQELSEKFGPYCVLISGHRLIDALNKYHDDNGYQQIFGNVEYCKQNRLERINAFEIGSLDRFLFKDEDLAYQREYRLAIMQEIPEDHFIRVGKIEGTHIIESKELPNICFQINYKTEQIDFTL